MKEWLFGALAFLLVLGVVLMAIRWFSSVTTAVNVFEPEPGVRCVQVTSNDGLALHCDWRRP